MPAVETPERQSLAVIGPCFNEQQVIEPFHRALVAVLDRLDGLTIRVIYVDDGSVDGTLEALNAIAAADPRVAVYSLSRNFGHQVALTAGIDVADADAVVMLDTDLQHPPELITTMVGRWRAGADVVSAVRRHSPGAPLLKRASVRLFYWLINRLSETPIVPGAADFCLLSRRAHAALGAMPERHRFLRGMVSWIGFTRAYVEYDAAPRAAGASKYSFVRMVTLALDAVFSFSTTPMRLAVRLGALIVGLGVAYLVFILGRWAFAGDLVPGWASLISTVLILGGGQLVFIGVIGQYAARAFEESKRRPLYFFKQVPPGIELPAGCGSASDA